MVKLFGVTMKYRVWYLDKINISNTIIANNHKEGAKLFYNMFPRSENCWIGIKQKGIGKAENFMTFGTAELFPEKKWIEPRREKFDESKLDSHSLKLLEFIKKDHPDWLNNIFNCEKQLNIYNEKYQMSGFIIEILNPFQHYHPLEITRCGIEGEIVSFGPSWLDWYQLRRLLGIRWREWKHNDPNLVYESIELVVNEIIEEELISANGIFFTKEEYNLTLDQNTLIQALSWKGTYNYPKDG